MLINHAIWQNLLLSNERYRYPQGNTWKAEASPPLSPQGAGDFTLLSRHSLGKGTIILLPFLSLRWGMIDSHQAWEFMYFPDMLVLSR